HHSSLPSLSGPRIDGTKAGRPGHEANPSSSAVDWATAAYASCVDQGLGSQVRLAELLAALSLGIDLGFGQSMEHVLRQCRIAMRLAKRLGLDEPTRATVYYTAMLVNVGCHSDAHEQAKWFGDDIALKAGK